MNGEGWPITIDLDDKDALSVACAAGDISAVSALLLADEHSRSDDSDPLRRPDTPSPFLVACSYGHLEVCKLPRLRGSRFWDRHPKLPRLRGSGAIHYAAASGNLDLVKWLISKGGRPMVEARNRLGWTVLHVALSSGNEEITRWILDRCGDGQFGFDAREQEEQEQEQEHDAQVEEEEEEEYEAEDRDDDEFGDLRILCGMLCDVKAFMLAVESKMWWALPRVWDLSRMQIADLDRPSLDLSSRLMWSCRGCLDEVLAACSGCNFAPPGGSFLVACNVFLRAMQQLHETHSPRTGGSSTPWRHTRPMFEALAKHGYTAYDDTPASAQQYHRKSMILKCSQLGTLDILLESWFPIVRTVRHPDPRSCTIMAWIAKWDDEEQEEDEISTATAASCIDPQLARYLNVVSEALFGIMAEQKDWLTVILTAEIRTDRLSHRPTLRQVLRSFSFLTERTRSMMTAAGLGMLLELKRRGISGGPFAQVVLYDPFPTTSFPLPLFLCHTISLLDQLSRCEDPWPLFRILVGSESVARIDCCKRGMSMGAMWTMRIRRRASVADLLTNIHRAFLQARFWWCNERVDQRVDRGRLLQDVWMLGLLSCMDERGLMIHRLPARPHHHIYSMLFCLPGYYQ